jgi:hypothetical protein
MMVPSGYFKGQSYINQQQWRQLWQDCLRVDYEPSVHVQAVRSKTGAGDAGPAAVGLLVAIKETLKYTVKGEQLIADAPWLVELTYQLHKTRAIALGGVLRNYLSEAEPETEDLIHAGEDEGDISPDDPCWWFSWREMVKRYMGAERD